MLQNYVNTEDDSAVFGLGASDMGTSVLDTHSVNEVRGQEAGCRMAKEKRSAQLPCAVSQSCLWSFSMPEETKL